MHPRDSFWEPDDDETMVDLDYALPVVIDPRWHDDSEDGVDAAFEPLTQQLSPIESESLGNALRTIGRWASRAQLDRLAAQAAPIAGTAAGTAIGGPVGAMVGKAVGERVASVATGGARRAVPALTAPAPAPAQPGDVPPAPGNEPPKPATPAAAQLLYLVQNPAFLSSLVSLALGPRGQATVPGGPGGAPVGVGALMNLASTLATKATDEAEAFSLVGGDDGESYLAAPTTCPSCDPASATDRASALIAFLQAAEAESGGDEPYDDWSDDWNDDPAGAEWLDEPW